MVANKTNKKSSVPKEVMKDNTPRINLDIPESKKIYINDILFDVYMTDSDCMMVGLEMINKGEELKNSNFNEEAKEAMAYASIATEMHELIERTLGEGAIEKLSGRKSLDLNTSFLLWEKIMSAVFEADMEAVKAKYEQ